MSHLFKDKYFWVAVVVAVIKVVGVISVIAIYIIGEVLVVLSEALDDVVGAVAAVEVSGVYSTVVATFVVVVVVAVADHDVVVFNPVVAAVVIFVEKPQKNILTF